MHQVRTISAISISCWCICLFWAEEEANTTNNMTSSDRIPKNVVEVRDVITRYWNYYYY